MLGSIYRIRFYSLSSVFPTLETKDIQYEKVIETEYGLPQNFNFPELGIFWNIPCPHFCALALMDAIPLYRAHPNVSLGQGGESIEGSLPEEESFVSLL